MNFVLVSSFPHKLPKYYVVYLTYDLQDTQVKLNWLRVPKTDSAKQKMQNQEGKYKLK